MKKLVLTFLCNAIIIAALCVPAEARITVGILSADFNQKNSIKLGEALSKASGTEVKLRIFDNDAAITQWMLRFQEIDAAVVSTWYLKEQPSGTLVQIADIHFASKTLPPLALVTRSNLSGGPVKQIKEAFFSLGDSNESRRVMQEADLAGVTLPGKALKQKAIKTAPPTSEPDPHKPAPVTPEQTKEKTAPPNAAPLTPEKEPAKQLPPPAEKVRKQTVEKAHKTIEGPVDAQKPAILPAEDSIKVEQKTPEAVSEKGEDTQEKVSTPTKVAPSPAAAPPSEPVQNQRLVFFIILLIVAAVLLKISLFSLRWQQGKKSKARPAQTPEVSYAAEKAPAAVKTKELPTKTVSQKPPLVIEEGRLGPGKVPALLKRCADFPEPVVLQVSRGPGEKLIYFAAGQVAGAQAQTATVTAPELRWNKLGNLLIREEVISEQDRDQGLELLRKEPHLRFGEALLKLGLIDLAGLRHGLTRYARVTIYSLILFPEGQYKIFSGDSSLPAEESISLEITSLMREASQHQSEWTAIRQALPRLSTVLDFTQSGRSKLARVNLSPQQEGLLASIDGQRSISDLCSQSTMMDYEVYRFLYLMVRAEVLQ